MLDKLFRLTLQFKKLEKLDKYMEDMYWVYQNAVKVEMNLELRLLSSLVASGNSGKGCQEAEQSFWWILKAEKTKTAVDIPPGLGHWSW